MGWHMTLALFGFIVALITYYSYKPILLGLHQYLKKVLVMKLYKLCLYLPAVCLLPATAILVKVQRNCTSHDMKKMANVKLLVYLLGMLMLATPGKNNLFRQIGRPKRNCIYENWGIKLFSQLQYEHILSSSKQGPSYTGQAKLPNPLIFRQICCFGWACVAQPLLGR